MYKILIVFVFLLGLGKAEWIQLNNSSEKLAITVQEETDNYIIVNMKINGFENTEFIINNSISQTFLLPL